MGSNSIEYILVLTMTKCLWNWDKKWLFLWADVTDVCRSWTTCSRTGRSAWRSWTTRWGWSAGMSFQECNVCCWRVWHQRLPQNQHGVYCLDWQLSSTVASLTPLLQVTCNSIPHISARYVTFCTELPFYSVLYRLSNGDYSSSKFWIKMTVFAKMKNTAWAKNEKKYACTNATRVDTMFLH